MKQILKTFIMKRLILVVLSALIAIMAPAQAKLQTKKYILSDFPQKTMKVILTGDEMTDAALRSSVEEIWHLGPYEFCDMADFEASRKSEDFYFLLLTTVKDNNEESDGVKFFNIYKGKDNSGTGTEGLYKVTGIPYCPGSGGDGSEIAFLPPIINSLHYNVERIIRRTFNVGTVVSPNDKAAKGKWASDLLVDKSDLGFELGFSMNSIYEHDGIYCVEAEQIATALSERQDKLVCLRVDASGVQKNGTAYTMVFDASSYDMVYIKSHNISPAKGKGIQQDEMRNFMSRKK